MAADVNQSSEVVILVTIHLLPREETTTIRRAKLQITKTVHMKMRIIIIAINTIIIKNLLRAKNVDMGKEVVRVALHIYP